MISPVIQNAHSIQTGDQLAGQYAYSAADDAGYGMQEPDFEVHLDFLRDAGAEFNYNNAIAEVMCIKKQ